jgi:RHS repeat-associated protein
VYYLHGDHLGSVSMVTGNNTANLTKLATDSRIVGVTRYKPWGEERVFSAALAGVTPTDFRFTGQRKADVGSGTPRLGPGIYDYNARFYDATIGRFLSADTIVPDASDPQSYNRFSYVRNSPHAFTDPSGNDPWRIDDQGKPPSIPLTPPFGREVETILMNRFRELNPGLEIYTDDSDSDRKKLMSIFGVTPDIVVVQDGKYYLWSVKSEKRKREAAKDIAKYLSICMVRGLSCEAGGYWPMPGNPTNSDFIGLDVPGYEVGIRSRLEAPGMVLFRVEADGLVKAVALKGAYEVLGRVLKDKSQGKGRNPDPGPPIPNPNPSFLPMPNGDRDRDRRRREALTVNPGGLLPWR